MQQAMNDCEVMTLIVEYLLQDASNPEFKRKLNIILDGLRGRKHIEEERHPRYQSILLFGFNIFPFSIEHYRDMASLLKENTLS